uniref:ZF(RING)-14 zinc finger protein n=1 Tax=Phallusia mammillata TaxID=59560 RepID=A0A6F9D845_9ASCI|nr:ZF(RING)-14 zinc finger protein [Phallusia mammillata]
MIETDSTVCTCDPVSDRVSDKRTFTDNKSTCTTDDKPIDHILDDLNLLDGEKTTATIGQHIINSLTLPTSDELVHGNSCTCEIVQQFVGDLSDQLVKCIEEWNEKQNIKWATIEVCFLHKFKTLCKDAFSKTEQMSTAEKIACAFYIINEMPFRQMEQLAFNREFDNSRKQIIVFTCFLLQNFGFAKALSATLKQDDDDWFNTKFEIMTELIQDLASDQNFTTVSDNCEWVIECADLLHIGCTVQNLKAKQQQNLKKRKVKNCGNAVRDRERLFVHNNNMLLQQVATDGNIYDRARDPPGQRSVYIPPGDIYMESYRLSTFIKYPQEVPVNPRHLASAGFYYTGYKDRVKCFSCGLCCENWVFGDDVRSAQWHRSDCAFMRGGDSGNVPIGGGALARFMMPPRSPEGNNAMDTGPPSSNFTASIGTAKQVEQRSQVPSAGSVLLSHSGGSNQAIPMQTARPVARNQPLFQIVEFATIPSAYHENFLKNLDLRKESERARTFEHWPSETPTVYPADLARSGFFYLGNLDRVQCFSCGGVLRNWNYGDNVQAEHRRHFPHCKMCQGSETRNVQLTPDERAAVPSQQTVFHEPPDPSENEARDLRNMFQCQYPVSPHMRNEETRFETFDHRWPASQVNATPRQIARAGFFFLGERDRVKCWYCNGGLQNWDPQDEPWTEHAKWFPTCEFLLQRKGPDFVHRMVSMFPNLPRPLLRGPHDVAPPNPGRRIAYGTASARAPSPPPPIIDPQAEMQRERQQIQDAMNSDIVKAAIEMGFERKVVRHVVKRRIRRSAMCTTVAELVDDVTGNTSDVSDSEDEENESSMQSQPSTSAKTLAGGSQSSAPNEQSSMEIEEQTPSMQARIQELQEERKCKICLDNMADVVFVPCGHLCSCVRCAEALRKCPMCRKKIEKAIRTYMS